MPAVRRSIPLRAAGLLLALVMPAALAATPDGPPLEPLLAGEFALQAGKLSEAATYYLQAARATRNADPAERATGIALLAKEDARAAEALAYWRSLLPRGSRVEGLDVAEASLALRRGDDRAALRHLTALLARPGETGWRQALIVLAGGARSPKQAADILQKLVDRGALPPVLQAWLAYGGLAQRLDRPKLAERMVEEVVRRFPGDPRVQLLRASQLRESGRNAEARQVIDALVAGVATDEELRLAVAREYDALGDEAAAAATLARGPQDDTTYALRAALHAQDKDDVALQTLYDELARDAERPDPRRRLLLGQVAEYLKRYDAALDWYGSVPGGPQRWIARLRSANVMHALGRTKEAFDLLHALQQDAAAEDDTRRDAYLMEAALWEKDKRPERELDAFARGLATFPDDPELLYARALSHERRDDIPRAEADLRRILVAQPDNVAALNALGYTLADRTTRYQEALELINRALAAEPTNAAIIDSYGWVLYRLGRTREALVELQRAYALQEDAEIASHVAEVLWVLGRRDEAMRYFLEARRLDPDSRALARALEKTGARLPPAPEGAKEPARP